LSSSRPCAPSMLVSPAGTDSLPSMVLMVSSHTVAADTCTPCAEVMACRAFGPSRGLSSSSHSSAWLSRSNIAGNQAGSGGVIAGAGELLLDGGVNGDRLVVVGELPFQAAESPRPRLMRH